MTICCPFSGSRVRWPLPCVFWQEVGPQRKGVECRQHDLLDVSLAKVNRGRDELLDAKLNQYAGTSVICTFETSRRTETMIVYRELSGSSAGLSVPPTASEMEIAGALNRLIKELHFRVAARRLGDAIAGDIELERLVGEMEKSSLTGRRAGERLLES